MLEEKNPWTKLSSKVTYENDWIRVEHHEVLNPSKKEGIYGKVHIKNIAIGIIPIDEKGFTWLVGQFRYPLDEYSWEIPEGGGNSKVSPVDSAQRELLEETGIIAKKWEEIQRIHTSNSITDEIGIIYLAQALSFTEANPDENEELQIRKIHVKDAYQLILDGKITDSLSLVGLFKLKELKPELFS